MAPMDFLRAGLSCLTLHRAGERARLNSAWGGPFRVYKNLCCGVWDQRLRNSKGEIVSRHHFSHARAGVSRRDACPHVASSRPNLVADLSRRGIYCPSPGTTIGDRAGVNQNSPAALACQSGPVLPSAAAREDRSYEWGEDLCGTSARLQKLGAASAVVSLILSLGASAQVQNGEITGTVADPSGAVVPETKIVLQDLGTRYEIQVQTNSGGSIPPRN
jgi:hypothetical protein